MEPAELIGVNKNGICFIWRDLHAFFVGKGYNYKPWFGNGSGKAREFCKENIEGRIIVETELVKW